MPRRTLTVEPFPSMFEEEHNGGVDYEGRCWRCGKVSMTSGGCPCVLNRWQVDYSTWPDLRRLVLRGAPVPASMVRGLLEDYDRLRRER